MVVVDDEDEVRTSTVALARSLGCRIDPASQGAEAFRLVQRAVPDVLLMDLAMPIMDGWQAIRDIRALALPRRGPYIVAVSALVDADHRRRAFEAGCNEYVVKPFDVRSLLRVYMARAGLRT